MSWRVVSVVMIALFAILVLSTTTAGPLHEVTDTLVEIDDGDGGQYDTSAVAAAGLRAYGNLILILSFGLIAWGSWFILRRELTEGQL